MKKILLIVSVLIASPAFAQQLQSTTYTFMAVGVKTVDGNRDDGKFFLSRLPKEGEAVEMVFVGRDEQTGDLRFQLRVKENVMQQLTGWIMK